MNQVEIEELHRLQAENRALRAEVHHYRTVLNTFGATMVSVATTRLPFDLAQEGEQNVAEVLVDLTRVQDVALKSAGC